MLSGETSPLSNLSKVDEQRNLLCLRVHYSGGWLVEGAGLPVAGRRLMGESASLKRRGRIHNS